MADPSPGMVVPFIALLLFIAVAPFVVPQFWIRHYHHVASVLALIVIIYYLAALHRGPRLLEVLGDYVSFISLIGSLFTVAGGIHIDLRMKATTFVGLVFLLSGAVLANIIGTTGASMLLLRSFLSLYRNNMYPFRPVIFIFIVSNIGGVLTPLGDPPLFLGYLRGVPFFWLLQTWQIDVAWIVTLVWLLAVYAFLDKLAASPEEEVEEESFDAEPAALSAPHSRRQSIRAKSAASLGSALTARFVPVPVVSAEGVVEMYDIVDTSPPSPVSVRPRITTADDGNSHPATEYELLSKDAQGGSITASTRPSSQSIVEADRSMTSVHQIVTMPSGGFEEVQITRHSSCADGIVMYDVEIVSSSLHLESQQPHQTATTSFPSGDAFEGHTTSPTSTQIDTCGAEPTSPSHLSQSLDADTAMSDACQNDTPSVTPVSIHPPASNAVELGFLGGGPHAGQTAVADLASVISTQSGHDTKGGDVSVSEPQRKQDGMKRLLRRLRAPVMPIIGYTFHSKHVKLQGLHNFLWLALIIVLVLLQQSSFVRSLEDNPSFEAMGDSLGWTPAQAAGFVISFIFAISMAIMALLSHGFANEEAEAANELSFEPLEEVTFLFFGIFATMTPALDLLEAHASDLDITDPRIFYWGCGALSSFLDNAPTYLNFLAASMSINNLSIQERADVEEIARSSELSPNLIAISLASVFFGACTYLGNGPNMMVKSICHARGVELPTFFAYIYKFTLPILMPVLLVVGFAFVA